ncbi:MAG: hypothetical protein V2A74_00840 [bacterium]
MSDLMECGRETGARMKALLERRLSGEISAYEYETELRGLTMALERSATRELAEGSEGRIKKEYVCSDPRCAGRLRPTHDRRPREIQTNAGRMKIEHRTYCYCQTCGTSYVPTDEMLGVVEGSGCTAKAAAKICRSAANSGGYRRASEDLAETAELRVSPKQMQRVVLRIGKKLSAVRDEELLAWRLSPPRPERFSEHLAVSIDGSMIRFRDKPRGEGPESEWGEVKNAVVMSYAPSPEPEALKPSVKEGKHRGKGGREDRGRQYHPEIQDQVYISTRTEAERLVDLVARQLWLEGIERVKEVVLVADGAGWIDTLCGQLEEIFPKVAFLRVLDWTHANQRLAQIARAAFSDEKDQMKWWKKMEKALWEQDLDRVFTEIAALRKKLGEPPSDAEANDPREILRINEQYLDKRRDQIRYLDFRRLGVPIGSGTVESAGRHIVGERLKAASKRWTQNGAEAILILRTKTANPNEWHTFWSMQAVAA